MQGQRRRAGSLRQPEHGAFHGAALRSLHRGAAQDGERKDREIQAQDLGRGKSPQALGSRGGRVEARAVTELDINATTKDRGRRTMRERTLTRLLPRRAILAASAVIVMAALPASAQEPLKVGMSGPFSGGLSLLGQSVRDGVEVAFAEINEQGGIGGRKLQFIADDAGYEPIRTIASARKLVEQDNVLSLLALTRPPPSSAPL